jgi:PmbA protein
MTIMTTPHNDDMTARLQAGLATAERLGATAAKINFGSGEVLGCSFDAGRLKQTEIRQTLSYGIEVLVGGKRGSAVGNDLADLDEMVSRAVALAKMGSVAHFSAYPAPARLTSVKRYAQSTAELPLEVMIEAAQAIVDALKRYDPELHIVVEARKSIGGGTLVTSGGVSYTSAGTNWSLGGYAQRTEGTDMLFASYGRGWRELNAYFDPAYIADQIIEDLRRGEKIVDPPVGQVPVFVEPHGLGMLLWPVTLGTNGRSVAKGDSPLKGRLGQQVLDPALTLIDDPHIDFGNGAAEVDGDGIPTRRITLFDKGVLQCFLYDLDSAGLAEAEPTGNAGCSPYELEVLPGGTPAAELLASMDDGLYIKNVIGFGQSNVINGDFACNVALGFRVKGGKIIGRVKNTMAAGNIYEVFGRPLQLSSDRDPIERAPSAIVEGITISAGTEG